MLKGLKVKKNKKDADEVDEVKDSPKSSSPILQKKWKKDNLSTESQVGSVNDIAEIDPRSVQIDSIFPKQIIDFNKYSLQHDLIKQRIKEKENIFGETEEERVEVLQNQTKHQQHKQAKQEKQKEKQEMQGEKKNEKILSSCGFCLMNEQIGENFILANGYHTMMIFPKKRMFEDNWHIYILPIDHLESLQALEEDAWQEVRNFIKCLVGAFDSINMEAVFFENAYKFNNIPHCVLECVAVPYNLLKDVKLDVYFRQGMEELDGFWSTHKKIIKISKEQGGIRKQIPKGINLKRSKGFPYFYVDFVSHGYAHVIENEGAFSRNFAREILANVLRVEKNNVIAPKDYGNEEIKEKKQKFMQFWRKYDWTNIIQKEAE